MEKKQFYENLKTPDGKIDVVLDTDTYNEIDDQYALSYMICNHDKFNIKGIFAAPFFGNGLSDSPHDGLLKSHDEILKLLKLLKCEELNDIVFKGSTDYLKNEKTPQNSEAAERLVELAKRYTPEKPLYVVAIAAITNIASALLMAPEIAENIVIVWLGGHSFDYHDTKEFNMYQDIAASRVILNSDCPLVILPCFGVVSGFVTTEYELKHWLGGKNDLCEYLVSRTIEYAEAYAKDKPWSRPLWDVTAIGWLLNTDNRFMYSRIEKRRLPGYDGMYSEEYTDKEMCYVYFINRDNLIEDLFNKLSLIN